MIRGLTIGLLFLLFLLATAAAAQAAALEPDSSRRELDVLIHEGRFAAAQPLAVARLREREQAVGADSLEVTRNLLEVALLDQRTGRAAEGMPFAERALAIR